MTALPRPLFFRLHPKYRTPVTGNVLVGVFGLTALFISLATVSSMISFGALAAFSFVNLSVIKTYVIDRERADGADIVKYGVIPFLGFAFTIYLWTQLSGIAFEVGLAWLAVGLRLPARAHARVPEGAAGDVHGRGGAGAATA